MIGIKKFRKEIDKIDKRILNLLDKRIRIALKISNLKREQEMEVFQPAREIEILERLKSLKSLLKPKNIDSIWKEIINTSKEIQAIHSKIN